MQAWYVCLPLWIWLYCACVCLGAQGQICWQVVCQERDSGAFEIDTRDESQSEQQRKRASFTWLCIPPRHRQREAQDETCVPLATLPLHIQPPPAATDLNIYQRSPMLAFLLSISVLVRPRHTQELYNTVSRGNLFRIVRHCGGPVLVVPGVEQAGLETNTHTDVDTCLHTFSPVSCFFIVPPVTLSYSFNLSLEPADSTVCVCTASGTMPKKPHCHSY